MRFNMRQELFPSNMVASFFRFQASEFFLVSEAEKAAPRANLSLSS
jgi:hypothetical protein